MLARRAFPEEYRCRTDHARIESTLGADDHRRRRAAAEGEGGVRHDRALVPRQSGVGGGWKRIITMIA